MIESSWTATTQAGSLPIYVNCQFSEAKEITANDFGPSYSKWGLVTAHCVRAGSDFALPRVVKAVAINLVYYEPGETQTAG